MKVSWKAANMLYPVPAVLVSCGRKGEKPNVLTVAWTGTVCSDPVMVSVSIRRERFSHNVIAETGEFVINLTTEQLAKAADLCGIRSGRDCDKFALAGLTAEKVPQLAAAPSIAEAPVSLACRVKQILPLGSHDLFLAEVVGVQVEESLLDEKGSLHLERAGLISYSHGGYYTLGRLLGTFGFSVRKKAAGKSREKTARQAAKTGNAPAKQNTRSRK